MTTQFNQLIKKQPQFIKEIGKELIEHNTFFNDLSNLMNNTEFKHFFDTYFNDMIDIKTTMIYMKLYRLFQKQYKKITNHELSRYVIIYILYTIYTDSKTRPIIIDSVMKHLNDSSKPILAELMNNQQVIKKKKKKINKYINTFVEPIKKSDSRETCMYEKLTGINYII